MITFHLISLFPESFESYLNASILKRAQEDRHISLKYYNPRDFVASGKKRLTYAKRRVDDKPYGGGPGMVIEALPVIRAIAEAVRVSKKANKKRKRKIKIVFFNPAGKQFTNETADSWKKYSDLVLVCGRYEGIDARVKKAFPVIDVSVGPYTLTGGELPAMVLIDAIARRLPGVLGDYSSLEESRISSHLVYTRPEVVEYKNKKYRVPKILLSGNQAKINEWKKSTRIK